MRKYGTYLFLYLEELSEGHIFRLLVATPTMLDRAGELMVDILEVQSDQLLLLIILALILVYSCAKILLSMVSLVWLILEHFVRLHLSHLVSMLESTKNDKMFWQLLRYKKNLSSRLLCTRYFQPDFRRPISFL
jgi:hypothetical protein